MKILYEVVNIGKPFDSSVSFKTRAQANETKGLLASDIFLDRPVVFESGIGSVVSVIETWTVPDLPGSEFSLSFYVNPNSSDGKAFEWAWTETNNKAEFRVNIAGSKLLGDVNEDKTVNIIDLSIVAKDFGAEGEGLKGDVNGDKKIDIADLMLVAKNWSP